MQHVKGPDFPTGGIILGHARHPRRLRDRPRPRARAGARAHRAAQAGQGGDRRHRAALHGQEGRRRRPRPEDRGARARTGASRRSPTFDDESDKRGMRLVIELKRDAIPKVVLNKLYKHTPMQSTFGVNMVALVDGVPRTLNLREVIQHYVAHQREVVVRRTKHELAQKEARAHILEGLLIALEHLDAVIELIRASRDREAAREQLIERFELSATQANAILDLRLSQLTALEADGDPAGARRRRRADRRAARDPRRRASGARRHQGGAGEIAERFADERRTEISHSEDEIDIEDLIADQQMVIAITHSGYIKSLPLATYRAAAPRRPRRERDGPEGRRLHRAPLHLLDARLPAVLHQPRQGLPLEGLRAAGGLAHREGPRARQRPAAARGRAGAVGALHARLLRGPLPRLRDAAGDRQEDRVRRLQHADQRRRHHRDQDPRRRRAGRGAPHLRRGRHPDGLALRPGGALPGVAGPRDGPRHERRARA